MNKFVVEIMDSSSIWQDRTADCMGVSIQGVGLVGQRYAYPQTGRCTLTMANSTKRYSPSSTIGADSGAVDSRRRMRIRASGPTLGNKMQATLSGTPGTTTTAVTPHVSDSTHPTVSASNWISQRIVSSVAGIVRSVIFDFLPTTGSGTATASIYSDNSGVPGALLATGTFNPATAASPVEILMPSGALVTNSTPVHVVWKATNTLQYRLSEVNAGYTYNYLSSATSGASWSTNPNPVTMSITVWSDYGYQTQTVSNSSSTGDVFVLAWQGKAQFDGFVNTDNMQFLTNAETGAVQVNTYTNKWKSYSFTFTTTANATSITPRIFQNITSTLYGATTGIEYKNFTLKKNGGSNLLTNGDFSSGVASPWTATSVGAMTLTLSVSNDYWVLFQGFVETIQPSMGLFGDLQCQITCVDWVEIFKLQNINTVLQESKTADQLISYALSFLTAATFNATPPGTLLDTGLNTFDRVFDGNTQSVTSILEVCTDAVMSDFGRFYVDRDGTVRFINRNWLPNTQNTAAKLTLGAGMAWGASQRQPIKDIATIINSAILTYHPRLVGGGVQVLATATTAGAITIPPKKSDGTAGTTTLSLTYHDATGRTIGGKNVVPPVATTDYTVFDDPNGNGFNYTSNSHFSITNEIDAASQTTLTLNNTATGPLYATLLQVRGNPVTIYDPIQIKVTDPTSISAYQERTFTKDLLYGMDQQYANSLAQWLVAHYKYPFLQYGGVKIDRNTQTIAVSTDLLSLELFDIVSVTDAQNNVSGMRHVIVGINYEFDPLDADYISSIEFVLERIDQAAFFILDDVTYGELDSVTNLLYI